MKNQRSAVYKIFAFLFPIFSAVGAQADWLDNSRLWTYQVLNAKTCVPEPTSAAQKECCKPTAQAVNGVQQARNFSDEINKKVFTRDTIEKMSEPFLKDFSKDQYDQSVCEEGMFNQLDLVDEKKYPNSNVCHESLNDAIANALQKTQDDPYPMTPSAAKFQATILGGIWEHLDAIARSKKICDSATKHFRGMTDPFRSKKIKYMVPEDIEIYEAARDEMASKCDDLMGQTSLAREYSRIWNGQDRAVQKFVNYWIDQRHAHPKMTESEFIRQALPVDLKTFRNLNGNTKWNGTFQHMVVEPMKCNNRHRLKVLSNVEPQKPGQPLDRHAREVLFDDDGEAALSFMSRSKSYQAVAPQLSCILNGKYGQGRKDFDKIVFGFFEGVIVTGSVIATSGATVPLVLNGVAIAADTVVIGKGLVDLKNACGGDSFGLGALESEPVCEEFARAQGDPMAWKVLETYLEKKSCLSNVFEVGLAGANLYRRARQAILQIKDIGNHISSGVARVKAMSSLERYSRARAAVNDEIGFLQASNKATVEDVESVSDQVRVYARTIAQDLSAKSDAEIEEMMRNTITKYLRKDGKLPGTPMAGGTSIVGRRSITSFSEFQQALHNGDPRFLIDMYSNQMQKMGSLDIFYSLKGEASPSTLLPLLSKGSEDVSETLITREYLKRFIYEHPDVALGGKTDLVTHSLETATPNLYHYFSQTEQSYNEILGVMH